MRAVKVLMAGLVILAVAMAGCDKSVAPSSDTEGSPTDRVDLASLQSASWPQVDQAPPSPLVTVAVGDEAISFWPWVGKDFSGTPKDPINLIFYGQADPRDIREALMSLDGDRTAMGYPPAPPFNAVWQDAIGDVFATYGDPGGWTGGAIQLSCGDYGPIRFHLRLFKVGNWTVGGAHFELLIPGTSDHQVLSWEKAEQFVMADFIRSGLLDPVAPVIPTDQINDSPFRTIPAIIYNAIPIELKAFIEGPLGEVTEDVPIGTDGHAVILNLANGVPWEPGVWTQNLTIDYDIAAPKPFCSSGPYDFVYITGPVDLQLTSELTADGVYTSKMQASGYLQVTPIDPMTGQPVGETLDAVVSELNNSVFAGNLISAALVRHQGLYPFSAPGAGWFFERFRVSSNGGNGYQLIARCQTDQVASANLVASAGTCDIEGGSEASRLVSLD